jgi:Ca2+-dependent lipid-binding protein
VLGVLLPVCCLCLLPFVVFLHVLMSSFTFKLPSEDLLSSTLDLSIYNWNMTEANEHIGTTHIALKTCARNVSNTQEQTHGTQQRTQDERTM